MGVIATQHSTDGGSGLLIFLVGSQAVLVHRIENAAVNRLQTVTHIRQRTADDDTHSVFNVGAFHFVDQIRLADHLIREHNIFRLISAIMLCHFVSPP